MGHLNAFLFITLNGYYKGPGEDISWHKHSNAAAKFSNEVSQTFNILLFGRKTYEIMEAYWPTPAAAETYPIVAHKMNTAIKIVCSNTLQSVNWEHTRIMSGDIFSQIKKLKEEDEHNITILGSGNLVKQLTEAGLIDSYMIMIDPLAIPEGTALFEGISSNLNLILTSSRILEEDGIVVLTYERSDTVA